AFDRAHGTHSLVARLGRGPALQVSWLLHLVAIAALALAVWRVAFAHGAPPWPWALVTALAFAGTVLLLWLEQRWGEDVNLAFFKTNVAVGFLVLATVLAARMASGGFA